MFPIANGIPLRYPPIATWALIAVNCVVFLYEVSLTPSELDAFLYSFALVPARYSNAGILDAATFPADYLPFFYEHVLTRRLAAADRQCGCCGCSGEWSWITGLETLSRLLLRLRCAGLDYLRGPQPDLDSTGAGRLRGQLPAYSVVMFSCFRSRTFVLIPILFFRCFFRGSGARVRRALVLVPDFGAASD